MKAIKEINNLYLKHFFCKTNSFR